MKKIIGLVLLILLMSHPLLYGQNTIQVSGSVTEKPSNEALIGVTVLVKGTATGTVTDINGNYTLPNIPTNATLVFSYIGMQSVTQSVNGRTVINVQMESAQLGLSEIVVVGYGTQKSKDLTAPIVTIQGESLSRQIAANPMTALQGKVSGVQVINSGAPGAGPTVKIRGVGTIGNYANPLYVVDGVFVDNIDFLSSSDIGDLTVLKDASAAAIYGVRAANGVVLISTKKGKLDQTNISYDGYVGVQMPVNVMKLTNTAQYVQLMNEANANLSGYTPMNAANYPASVDWYSELLRNAIMHNHSLDISGATNKTNYSVGANYFFQEGIMDARNNYERVNLRARLDQKVNDWLSIGINNILSNYAKYSPNNDAFFQAFVNPPVYPVRDGNNSDAFPVKFGAAQDYGFGNSYGNPVAMAYYNNNREQGIKDVTSVYAELNILKDKLKFKTAYNLNYESWKSRNYTPEYLVGGSQSLLHSRLTKTFGIAYKHIIDNLLTLNDKKGKHSYSALLGQSTRMERKYTLEGTALNVPFIDEQSLYLSRGSLSGVTLKDYADDTNPFGYNGLSFFTRGTYNYDDKYLATFTFRADGSSKYQQKWGYFPSLGFGWILTKEDFMKNQKFFDYLKFRASWGMLGNDNIPANSAQLLGTTGAASSGVFNDALVEGVGAQTVVINYLKWEVVNELNLGFDFNIIKQKLRGDLDYYNRITSNVVFKAPISAGGGTADLLGNYGTVQNQGVELSLNWDEKIKDDLSYHLGLNATTIANKVISLKGKRAFIPEGSVRNNFTTRTAVGHPIGAFYGYEVAGVYASEIEALQDPVSQIIKLGGYFKYKDQNGDKVIDENDKVYLGSPIPWMIFGIDCSINYKRFDAEITLQSQIGNKVLNAKRMNRDVFGDGNYDEDFFKNRWTSSSKSDTYPSADAYNSSFIQQANDFFVEDASYIRIQNIQVGYNIDEFKGVKNIRVYLSAQRPFTYFTYNGFTPEVSGDPLKSGIDTNTYPMQAVYTAGVKINF